MKTIVSLILVFSLGLFPGAAKLKLNHISVNKGLSQQDVETMMQDHYGFMWFGTYDGLNRFDGYNIETFRHDPHLPNTLADNRITALFESSNGIIWIGTEGSGLLYFDPSADTFSRISHPLLSPGKCGSIYSIKEIPNGRLLLGSTLGLMLISEYTSETPNVSFLMPNVRVRNLTLEDEMIWVGTQTGVYKVALTDKNSLIQLFRDQSNRFVYGVAKLSESEYAIYGVGGIDFYSLTDGQYKLRTSQKRAFPRETIVGMVRNGDDWLIATLHTVFRWKQMETPEMLFKANVDFFQNNLLQEIIIGTGNNLWISSRNKGVAHVDLSPAKFSEFPLPDKDLYVKSMIIRRDGRKTIGVKDYGMLTELSPGSDKFNVSFSGNTVTVLMEDSRTNLWFFSRQMYILMPGNSITTLNTFTGFDAGMGGHMSACEDKRGIVWVGTSRAIARVDFHKRKIDYIPFPANEYTSSANLSLNIYYDEFNDAIFCCTKEEGLYRYDIKKEKLELYNTNNGLTSNHVWCLTVENDSVSWVGTDVGVNRFLRKENQVEVTPVSSDEPIRNAKVMAITMDKKNNLWFTTSQGLFSFNTLNGNYLEFDFSDGLLSNSLSEVAYIDKQGQIWISSISGLNYFNPEALTYNQFEPNLVLRELRIFNVTIQPNIPFNNHIILTRSLLETKHLTLRHNENNFQLEVAPIHYSNPLKNKIAYKLSGIDKDWIETRNRIISYNNLPSGNYILEIKGANNDGVWTKKSLRMNIRVKPAPWLSWWAYLIYSLVFIFIIILIYRYYTGKRELKLQLEREQMKHDSDREINEAKLRFHTNITHEIRTPLALIAAPLYELLQLKIKDNQIQKHIQTIARNTDVLTRLVNQFLDFRKAVTMNYPLRVTEGNLRMTVENTFNLFSEQAKIKGINYQYICEQDSFNSWYDEEKLSKIIMNIIANAFKFTPKDGSIFVFLEQDDSNAQIIVEDTGCGIATENLSNIFSRYYQVVNTKGGTGIGLSLAKQLAEIHHGSISVESEIGKGSTFVVQLPVVKDAFSEDELDTNAPERPVQFFSTLIREHELEMQDEVSPTDAPIILIVEDNQDMADYMISSLSNQYRIYHTINGSKGLELALVHTPDIILSDIMVEGMDGIQLTQTLKSDIRTSHIPVILISARSSEEEVMEGLHTGAEDYLVKPFNPEVLKLKIANLIRLSQQVKDKEQDSKAQLELSEREQKFVDELTKIIRDEMINPDFNIEYVCKRLGTNRMQLHRKMMSILGLTTSEYIKKIRFEHAYKLLETTDMNISETMYEVGLSSLYNFTQTFQKMFDENPSDIIRNRKKFKL
ncbi:MAG: ATP-binding protein [Paludibacter sp.]|jgi:signal transduction histidine kinase/ligand-binding sensor domain-containing protein/CheY-like chemotaxis protein/AraC-like DNA-binding protein|nr:ATP-binding protein [Paludibacter sp.]